MKRVNKIAGFLVVFFYGCNLISQNNLYGPFILQNNLTKYCIFTDTTVKPTEIYREFIWCSFPKLVDTIGIIQAKRSLPFCYYDKETDILYVANKYKHAIEPLSYKIEKPRKIVYVETFPNKWNTWDK